MYFGCVPDVSALIRKWVLDTHMAVIAVESLATRQLLLFVTSE